VLFPIPKAGKEQKHALDLRPIALTATLGKLFERVVNENLMSMALEKGFISQEQCGFVRGRSTMGPTTRIVQRLRTLPMKRARAGAFLDVKKAYNSVWHNGLLHKMLSIGIPEGYVRWISDWIRARRYQSRVMGEYSKSCFHEAGVPQGTVLSPLLFILFFSDVAAEVSSEVFLFADDVSLISRSFLVGSRITFSSLQGDIIALERWATKWKMEFEPAKTNLVIFTRSKSIRRDTYRVRMGGSTIAPVRVARCLGIWLDQEYTMIDEAKKKIDRFQSKIKLLLRIAGPKWGCPPAHLLRLYVATAVPALAHNPWSLFLAPKRYLKKAVSIQRRTIKRFLSLPSCSGGDVAEVYAKVPPIDLVLRRRCASTLMNLVSGNDVWAKMEYETYLDSQLSLKDVRRKVATWQSPFGALLKSVISLGLPLWPEGKKVTRKIIPDHGVRFPRMRKFQPKAKIKEATEFSLKEIREIPADRTIVHTCGVSTAEGVCRAGIFVQNEDGSSSHLVVNVRGKKVSHHIANVVAVRLALGYIKRTQVKATIVSTSRSAVSAVLSLSSSCFHARETSLLLQKVKEKVSFTWVPTFGFSQHDEVKEFALGASVAHTVVLPTSSSDLLRMAKCAMLEKWNTRWKRSSHSPELHDMMPDVPSSRRHTFGTHTARAMARVRTGHCGVPVFLCRHGLMGSNRCQECDGAAVGTVEHFFSCEARSQLVDGVIHEFKLIVEGSFKSVWDVFSVNLEVGKQIRIANVVTDFFFRTTEFGFL